jgi:hypothetical protein
MSGEQMKARQAMLGQQQVLERQRKAYQRKQ